MAGPVKGIDHAIRLNLGIRIRCACGKAVLYRAWDLREAIPPGIDIESARFRCTWCGGRATDVRYQHLGKVERQDLASWPPRTWHRKQR